MAVCLCFLLLFLYRAALCVQMVHHYVCTYYSTCPQLCTWKFSQSVYVALCLCVVAFSVQGSAVRKWHIIMYIIIIVHVCCCVHASHCCVYIQVSALCNWYVIMYIIISTSLCTGKSLLCVYGGVLCAKCRLWT